MKKTDNIIIFLILFSTCFCFAQEREENSLLFINYFEKTRMYNFEKKYPYKENTRYIVETQIAPAFLLYSDVKEKKYKSKIFTFTPDINIRYLHEYSAPVLTPFFLIHFRYHKLKFSEDNENLLKTFVVGINHFSNGQSEHIIKDTLLNLERGNFSSHYLEGIFYWVVGAQGKSKDKTIIPGIGLELHSPDSIGRWEIPGAMSKFLGDNYGKYRLIMDIRLVKRITSSNFLNGTMLTFYFYSNSSLFKPKGNSLHPEFREPEKLPKYRFYAEIQVKPSWKSSVGVFARYYYGQDHYNLYFYNTLKQFQFGFIMDNFTYW